MARVLDLALSWRSVLPCESAAGRPRMLGLLAVLACVVGCTTEVVMDCPPPADAASPDAAVVVVDAAAPPDAATDSSGASLLDAHPSDARPDDAQTGDAQTGDAGTPRGRPTIYYVIRHAERDPGLDPPINDEGRARAERLAAILASAGIDEIVGTMFVRTQQTAEPLSRATGVGIVVAPAVMGASWSAFGAEVGAWLRDREVPGSTVLVIGHSAGFNSEVVRALGGVAPVGERYQDLTLVVRETDGTVRTSTLEYGGPSTLDP